MPCKHCHKPKPKDAVGGCLQPWELSMPRLAPCPCSFFSLIGASNEKCPYGGQHLGQREGGPGVANRRYSIVRTT